jgi:hypothetical protein
VPAWHGRRERDGRAIGQPPLGQPPRRPEIRRIGEPIAPRIGRTEPRGRDQRRVAPDER